MANIGMVERHILFNVIGTPTSQLQNITSEQFKVFKVHACAWAGGLIDVDEFLQRIKADNCMGSISQSILRERVNVNNVPANWTTATPELPPQPLPNVEPIPPFTTQLPDPVPPTQEDNGWQVELNKILSVLHPTLVEKFNAHLAKQEGEIKRLLEESSKPRPLDVPGPITTEYVEHAMFKRVMALVKLNIQTKLVGPAGTGKTRMAREVLLAYRASIGATEEEFPIHLFGFAGATKAALTWSKDVKPDGSTGLTISQFLRATTKPGGSVLDEIFGSEPENVSILIPYLEQSTGKLTAPDGQVFVKHPEHRLIATSNTTGRSESPKHAAAQTQDYALVERFPATVFIDYDKEVERRIIEAAQCPGGHDVLEKHWNLRKKAKEVNIMFDFSTRRLIWMVQAIRAGMSYEEAFDIFFKRDLSEGEQRKLGV